MFESLQPQRPSPQSPSPLVYVSLALGGIGLFFLLLNTRSSGTSPLGRAGGSPTWTCEEVADHLSLVTTSTEAWVGRPVADREANRADLRAAALAGCEKGYVPRSTRGCIVRAADLDALQVCGLAGFDQSAFLAGMAGSPTPGAAAPPVRVTAKDIGAEVFADLPFPIDDLWYQDGWLWAVGDEGPDRSALVRVNHASGAVEVRGHVDGDVTGAAPVATGIVASVHHDGMKLVVVHDDGTTTTLPAFGNWGASGERLVVAVPRSNELYSDVDLVQQPLDGGPGKVLITGSRWVDHVQVTPREVWWMTRESTKTGSLHHLDEDGAQRDFPLPERGTQFVVDGVHVWVFIASSLLSVDVPTGAVTNVVGGLGSSYNPVAAYPLVAWIDIVDAASLTWWDGRTARQLPLPRGLGLEVAVDTEFVYWVQPDDHGKRGLWRAPLLTPE